MITWVSSTIGGVKASLEELPAKTQMSSCDIIGVGVMLAAWEMVISTMSWLLVMVCVVV